jgi:hypothetical protein
VVQETTKANDVYRNRYRLIKIFTTCYRLTRLPGERDPVNRVVRRKTVNFCWRRDVAWGICSLRPIYPLFIIRILYIME